MQEYQSNSHKSKREAEAREQERRVEKVVSSPVKTRENKVRKVKGLLFSDSAGSVWTYALLDVLVPAFKKALYDIITGGADRVIYGEDRGGREGKRSGSKVSYRSYYDDRDSRDRETRRSSRERFDQKDIVYTTRGDAEAVLRQMKDTLDRYEFVTVADQYEMSNEEYPHTATKYGWESLRGVKVIPVRGGYIIDLPPARPF